MKSFAPRSRFLAALLAAACLAWQPALAQPPHEPPPARDPHALPELPAIEKIGPGMYALGEIRINKNARSLSFPASVNMGQGLLEYLLVRVGGKTHESLFRTKVEPAHLQLALLLLGAEGTNQPLDRQGSGDIPQGAPLDITVTYQKDGRVLAIKPEAWIAHRDQDKFVDLSAPLKWVFTGSMVHDGLFLAQIHGSMASIFRDPAAIVDNASPGGESDRMWYVKETAIPPAGTPVTLTFTLQP